MKLPNFFEFEALNELRRRMGATELGSINSIAPESRLTQIELDLLISPDGIELASLDQIRVLPDGTLAFKDSRVLLYIRDHTKYGDREIEPRFHVANCRTLQEMKRVKRFERYVIAANTNNEFRLNIIYNNGKREELRKLLVCQNCMDILHFDGFDHTRAKHWRNEFVRAFLIDQFFRVYPRSLHTQLPQHSSDTAPLNDYTQDFSAKSNAVREMAHWTCENGSCRALLSEPRLRRFLHVHHVNGLKSDDRRENLRVLCISCHANEPGHTHMKSLPEYKQYLTLRSP